MVRSKNPQAKYELVLRWLVDNGTVMLLIISSNNNLVWSNNPTENNSLVSAIYLLGVIIAQKYLPKLFLFLWIPLKAWEFDPSYKKPCRFLKLDLQVGPG